MSERQAEETTDWLIYWLKRVPADQALLRAWESRLLAALELPAACLDLRDRFGRGDPEKVAAAQGGHDCAIFCATPDNAVDEAQLSNLRNLLNASGLLVLTVAADDPAEQWAERFQRSGFAVVQWQPFLSDVAQQACRQFESRWPQLFYDLTGHYVPAPWPRFIDPAAEQLRPFMHEPAAGDGNYFFFLLRKSGSVPSQQRLPPARPLSVESRTTPVAVEAPTRTERIAVSRARAASGSDTGRAVARPLAATVAVVLAATAVAVMRREPPVPGSGVIPWLFALAALAVVSVSHSRPAGNLGGTRKLQAAVDRLLPLLLSIVLSILAYQLANRPAVALPLWLLAIVVAWWSLAQPRQLPQLTVERRTWLLLVPILLGALLLRTWRLTTHPFIVNGIEAQLGLEALRVSNPFSTAWLTNPTLPLFLTKPLPLLLGQNVLALRLLSPLIGTLTIGIIYLIGSRLWHTQAGLLAALLLAGSHVHIHYSRLGMTNIWDPLILLLSLGAGAVGWHSGRRSWWLLAGFGIGFGAYFYTTAHLLPLMLLVLLPFVLFANQFKQQWQNVATMGMLAFVIALPQLLFYRSFPVLFMERADALGILRNGWLISTATAGGETASAVLGRQLWQALLGFHGVVDRDPVYNPGTPLLSFAVGILFVLGIGMALAHIRQMRYLVWLAALLVTMIFGGWLLTDVPYSRRYLIALPAALLLAARAFVWLLDKVSANTRLAKHQTAVVIAFGVVVALFNVGFYFGSYQQSDRFGDRNSEIAFAVGQYLSRLDAETVVYFYGAPAMYTSFPTIGYLAPQFQPSVNLFDVSQPEALQDVPAERTVHIFVPERAAELEQVRQIQPGGTWYEIDGRFAEPLFIVYEWSR